VAASIARRDTLGAMRFGWLLIVLACIVPSAAVAANPPTKQQVEEAQTHFFKATDLYNDGDYANAALEFKRAYEIAPDFHVLYNVGQTCYLASDYACALDAFTRYLADGGKQVPAKRRVDVEKDIKKLQGRVAKVEIATNVPGATIAIDEEKRGTTPLEGPLTVSQGKRKITAAKEGYEPATEVVEIAGGEARKIELVLKEIEKPPPPPPPPPKVVRRNPLPFIGIGVTGALAVGAVITGIVAINASDKANNRLATFGANPNEIKSLESDASTFALVTDILGIAAVAVGVTTAVLFVIEGKSQKTEPKQAIAPFFGPWGAGVAGTF
jgi:hypothetical protein